MNRLFRLLLLAVLCWPATVCSAWADNVPEFSTAGFYALPETGREVYSMNPGWRFLKGAADGAEPGEAVKLLAADRFQQLGGVAVLSGTSVDGDDLHSFSLHIWIPLPGEMVPLYCNRGKGWKIGLFL